MAAWMEGKFGGEWIHVHDWLTTIAVHLKLLQHCLLILYRSDQSLSRVRPFATP